jgi:hypothetical protein
MQRIVQDTVFKHIGRMLIDTLVKAVNLHRILMEVFTKHETASQVGLVSL